MSKYREVVEIVSEDHRMLRAQVMKEDGSWNDFMVTNYRRKK